VPPIPTSRARIHQRHGRQGCDRPNNALRLSLMCQETDFLRSAFLFHAERIVRK
jgi:hypothetical protein